MKAAEKKRKICDENYFRICGWMINLLGLHGTELMTYAMIYAFSRDGLSEMKGGVEFAAAWCGVSYRTEVRTLARLCEKGLIIKRECGRYGGRRLFAYMAVIPETGEMVYETEVTSAVSEKADKTGASDESLPATAEELFIEDTAGAEAAERHEAAGDILSHGNRSDTAPKADKMAVGECRNVTRAGDKMADAHVTNCHTDNKESNKDLKNKNKEGKESFHSFGSFSLDNILIQAEKKGISPDIAKQFHELRKNDPPVFWKKELTIFAATAARRGFFGKSSFTGSNIEEICSDPGYDPLDDLDRIYERTLALAGSEQ